MEKVPIISTFLCAFLRALLRSFPLSFAHRLGQVLWNKLGASDVDTAAHRASALQAARESIVLLNNSAGVLPLKTSAGRKPKIACIGVLGAIVLSSMNHLSIKLRFQ